MFNKQSEEIQTLIQNYFEGIYNGNEVQLKEVFHLQALLFGDINGTPYFKTLADYIDGVKSRKSPADMGEEFKMKILGIEILGNVATTKLHVPMLGYNYYDFLSLTLENGKWKIVSKVFTHVE